MSLVRRPPFGGYRAAPDLADEPGITDFREPNVQGVQRWNKSASGGGITTYDCKSLADALTLAADVAAGRAA